MSDWLIGFIVVSGGALAVVALVLWQRVAALQHTLERIAEKVRTEEDLRGRLTQRIYALEQVKLGHADLGVDKTHSEDPIVDAERRPDGARSSNPWIPEVREPASTTAAVMLATESDAGPAPDAVHPTAPAPPPPKPRLEHAPAATTWEQWLGVRGAAALGAGVLVLAGLYFFKYSVERGLITPLMRVFIGAGVGVSCLLIAELWLRRRHEVLANWLSGAGIAISYVTLWAAHGLYGLLGGGSAAAALILVTAVCCALAVHRGAAAIAFLGLLGGFATPILLSTGSDRPIALFSYILLLDLGLLGIARHRRWPALALVSFVLTTFYQAAWIFSEMDPDEHILGMGILLVLGAVYAIGTPHEAEAQTRRLWAWTRAAALIIPFGFGIYFGGRADLGEHLVPIMVFATVLLTGAVWVTRRGVEGNLGVVAASCAVGIAGAWLFSHPLDVALAWEVTACFGGVGAVLLLLCETDRSEGHASQGAATVWALGATGISGLQATVAPDAFGWPLLAAWVVLAAIGLRATVVANWPNVELLVAAVFAVALATLNIAHPTAFSSHLELTRLLVLAVAGTFGAFAVLRPGENHSSRRAAALLSLLLASQYLVASPDSVTLDLAVALGLVVAVVALNPRQAVGFWALAALGVFSAVAWSQGLEGMMSPSRFFTPWHLATLSFSAALLTAQPFVLPRSSRDDRWLWWAATAATVLLFVPTFIAYVDLLPDLAMAWLPLGFAVFPAVATGVVAVRGPADEGARKAVQAWMLVCAIGLVAVALGLHFEQEWLTIALAFLGVGTLFAWRRLRHQALLVTGVLAFAGVAVRLLLNPMVLSYHPISSLPVFNWLAVTYLVPAAALMLGWRLVSHHEEQGIIPTQVARLVFVWVCALVFVWLNLTVIEAFSAGPGLDIGIEHRPARDVVISLGWGAYSLTLLGLGMWRGSRALRLASLAGVLATCAKVFLFDLAYLGGLYRVASLIGLALALISVSITYQRFVFKRDGAREAPDTKLN